MLRGATFDVRYLLRIPFVRTTILYCFRISTSLFDLRLLNLIGVIPRAGIAEANTSPIGRRHNTRLSRKFLKLTDLVNQFISVQLVGKDNGIQSYQLVDRMMLA